MDKIKICITGSAGFIASSLAEKLVQNESYEVTGLDNLLTGKLENIPQGVKFIKCDVNNYTDVSEVFLANKFDYVFHLAAIVGVKRTLENPVAVLNDIEGFKNILSLSKNTGVKHVYFSSSSEVYGESIHYPQHEDTTPLNSKLPYAIVKNVGEAFLKSYYSEHGLPYTIFRFFNTYGPKQSPDFVISKFIKAALNNEDITIYGDGLQSRTFCYIDDNIDACIAAFEKRDTLFNNVLNIGNDREVSVLELAKLIIQITKSNSRIVHLPALKEGDMSRRLPDNSKMLELLGTRLLPLTQGINKILESK